ncbi:MAG: hypothetical protein ABI778_08160, partial [Ignavibacteriota bacterium]
GAQGVNINYTLPTAAAAANGYVLSSTTGGAMSWVDPATLASSEWHLTGNTGTSAWNGATGNIIGTLDAQDFVIGTGAVAGTREKVRVTTAGNLQLSQPGTRLSFLGTTTGVTTFQAGVQGATNLNYTLPITAPVASSLLYSSGGAASNLSWTNTGTNGQVLTITGGVPSWQNSSASGSFVNYNTATVQNTAVITAANYLFNVAYAASATTNNALGGVITSTAGTSGNTNATGLAVTATANASGTSTALTVNAGGGTTNYAALFNGGNVGVGNVTPATSVDITKDLATREYNYATSMSGTKNDWSFDGLNPANQMSFVRISTASAGFTITGVVGGQNGKYLTIYNGTNQTMTIANQNASSAAANRIITGTQVNIPIPTGGSADLIYSTAESRWVVHATSGVSGWLYTGNSGLTDGVNNFHGTLDNTPIRFVAGATSAPSTKMVLDINGNLLFGSNSGNAVFTQGSGRVAFGDSITTTRLASVPTYVNRVFNMIDPNAVVRIWRFNSNSGGTDPAIELVGGTNDNQGNAANHWWDVYATGTPGVAGSGTGGQGEHMSFRRRTGAHDSEYLAIFAGGNVGIGNNGVNPVENPDTRLVVRQVDGGTNNVADLISLRHTSSGNPTTGFGGAIVFKNEDSTAANQLTARIAGLWTNANHANRTGALAFTTVNAGTASEAVRIAGNGFVGVNTTAPNVSMDIDGAVATRAYSKSLSNGNNNNLTNLANESFARITGPTGAFTITGIAGGSDGQLLKILNSTSQSMTIADQSASSTAANRITSATGTDIVLTGSYSEVDLIYDATASRWIVTNPPSAGSGGSSSTIGFAYKASDQSVTSSTTLVNDNDLAIAINANDTWEIHGELHADCSSSTPNIKVAFTIPAGATMKIFYNGISDGGVTAGASVLTASGVSKTVNITGGTSTYIQIHGIVLNGGNSGNIQLKWAQGTSNGNSVILRTNTFLRGTKVN